MMGEKKVRGEVKGVISVTVFVHTSDKEKKTHRFWRG